MELTLDTHQQGEVIVMSLLSKKRWAGPFSVSKTQVFLIFRTTRAWNKDINIAFTAEYTDSAGYRKYVTPDDWDELKQKLREIPGAKEAWVEMPRFNVQTDKSSVDRVVLATLALLERDPRNSGRRFKLVDYHRT